ncbi:hypothetical protein RRF57_003090 [Xylaria bambusicola]|uniref:Uncharacterized protein n=1 Tax=Xylaria bambusicola TaxID=326684 RepID=A0AAN7U7D7_9PEZI
MALQLWITPAQPASHDEESEAFDGGYPFSGYYLPYPDTKYEGLVSTISDDPPVLNWIYVDKETYEVKYGLRTDAQPHLTGPFDCTRQDRRMTFEGWEGFVAVEDYPGMWALYFDRDDDGLATKVPMGTRVLEVELTRREKKERKPEPDPNQPQTLDEKMKQHKEQSQRQEEETNGFLQDEQLAQHQEQTSLPDSEPASFNNNGSRPDSGDAVTTLLNIEKLKLDSESATNPQKLTAPATSPSIHSDNMSFWSSAKKADDNYDNASVTAASSIGVDESFDLNTQTRRDGQELLYQKPSVEDDLNHDVESVAM